MRLEISEADAIVVDPYTTLEGRGLTLLLHGFGAHERDLLPIAAVLTGDDVVLSLRAPTTVGPGFAWVDGPPEVVLSGAGLDTVADAVLRFIDDRTARHGTPAHVRLIGFSQGGALALAMLRRSPERFDRIVVIAGFVAASTEPGDALLESRRVPVLWVRGDEDDVIPPDVVDRTAAWLPAHADATVVVLPGLGHGVDVAALDAVRRFLT